MFLIRCFILFAYFG
jgi:hypothetical protein